MESAGSSIYTSDYKNASVTGQNLWKGLSYSPFAQVFAQVKHLNDIVFANIDSNNPDLTKFRDGGAKMLSFIGISDPFVSIDTMVGYYDRSSALTGGITKTQDFHRFFPVPGRGHCGGIGSVGTGGGNLPQISADQMYAKLVDWVENKQAPASMTISTPDNTKSRPICMYPKQVKYLAGDVNVAASYTCQ